MSKLVKALRPFASCDIGDALVKLRYPRGGYLDGISIWSPTRQGHGSSPRAVGEAVTVRMVDAKDMSAPTPTKHFADCAEADKIMYIQQPSAMYSACFGGLMATRAKKIGAAGVVIDGRFRDIEEIQALGLPLFARDNSILGSNTFTRASQINVPVQFKEDLWVSPGDILVGDQDGVVVVPPSLVDQVVELCKEREQIDWKTMQDLEAGMEMGPTLKKHR
ncbi:RraA-like protein [Polyplosphaeria fusca]|uniref:RraA-like protein n=1 Tax=Polyplosphaeria fusca TaxID=682080 RepID=A0A9P4QSA9_9PLEO|nr:RraA-like protein [Polyplosphaeria fusca]